MTTDLDALIADNRKWVQLHRENKYQREAAKRMTGVLDALESAQTELRQERERAGEAEKKLEMPCGSCHPCTEWANQTWVNAGLRLPHVIDWQEMTAALSCAEETIAKVKGYADRKGTFGFSELHNILAGHDRAKREQGDAS